MQGSSADFPPSSVERVSSQLSSSGIPGCVIMQVDASGSYRAMTLGYADLSNGRAMSLGTVARLYSGTKVVTASAIAKLMERGLISLETDVRELLPEVPLKHSITIEQLAAHTSGLPDTLRAFIAIHYPDEKQPSTSEALAKFELSKGRPPGHLARYRNVNYALLAEIVARTAETSYEDFVRTELLSPWGSCADFSVASFPEESVATGYLRRLDPMRLVAPWLLGDSARRLFGAPEGRHVSLHPFDLDCAGIGGLVGSAPDFAPIIAEFLSESDGVLQAESKRKMLSKHADGKVGVVSDRGVGLAWKLGEAGGSQYWNHEGGGPGYCSELRLYPAEGTGFVVLFNLSQSRTLSKLAHQICEDLRQVD